MEIQLCSECEMKFSSLSQLTKVSISNPIFVLKIQLSKVLWFLCPVPPPPSQPLHKPGRAGLQELSKIFVYSFCLYTKFRRTEGKEEKKKKKKLQKEEIKTSLPLHRSGVAGEQQD